VTLVVPCHSKSKQEVARGDDRSTITRATIDLAGANGVTTSPGGSRCESHTCRRAQKRHASVRFAKKPTYSRDGIHPQCAERQLDRARMDLVHREQLAAKEAQKQVNPARLKPFERRCPECFASLRPHKTRCECGHRFNAEPRARKGFRRRCPKCRLQIHVRLLICECGYEFLRLRLEKKGSTRNPK
jgi:hypothetical protein